MSFVKETTTTRKVTQTTNERSSLLTSTTYATYSYNVAVEPVITSVIEVDPGTGEIVDEGTPMVSTDLLVTTVKKVIRQNERAVLAISIPDATAESKAPTQRRLLKGASSKSSSSSSSSSDEGEDASGSHRKRDEIKAALKSATDRWKEKHGWSSGVFQPATVEQSEEPQPPQPSSGGNDNHANANVSLPPVEVDIWGVAQYASVCTLLAMDNNEITQRIAIRTLSYGLKVSSNPTPRVLREMLLKTWIDGRSALDWAIANDCQVFLSDKKVQALMDDAWKYGGPAYTDWVDVPNHPCHAWQRLFYHRQHWLHVITNYLARWAAPRYQALVALFCGLVYLGLHLATLANVDYQGDYPKPHEYAYYFFVVSDVVLSLSTLRKPSTLFSLGVVFLLAASMVLRFVAFFADDLAAQATYVFWSFVLLAWATPLMIFRVALWMGDLSWHVAKVRYVVDQAMRDAFWVLVIGAVTLFAFWISLGALQREEGNISLLAMLRYLALGALHAPVIGGTLQFMPWAAGVMLFAYLVIMLLVVGTLLIASVLTTVLLLWPSLPHVRQTFFAQRAARRPGFAVFLPTVAIELVVGLVSLVLTGVFRMKKDSETLRWLEVIRQVLWFMVYSPVILIVALAEGIVVLAKKIF